jgi:hypothetical protein
MTFLVQNRKNSEALNDIYTDIVAIFGGDAPSYMPQ